MSSLKEKYRKGNVLTNIPLEEFLVLAPKGLVIGREDDYDDARIGYADGQYYYCNGHYRKKERLAGCWGWLYYKHKNRLSSKYNNVRGYKTDDRYVVVEAPILGVIQYKKG